MNIETYSKNTKLIDLFPSRYRFTNGGVVHATDRTGSEALCGRWNCGARFWKRPETRVTCKACRKRFYVTVGIILERKEVSDHFVSRFRSIKKMAAE